MNTELRAQAEALFHAGTRHLREGNVPAAEASLRSALQLQPDFAEAHTNLGLLLERKSEFAAAEDCYRRSLQLDASYAQTHLNLGALLARQKRFGEAELAYLQAILLRQHDPAGWSNLGVLYACMQREAEAERCYRNALALDAGYALARFNLAYVLLRQGRYEEGWPCLEARNWYAALAAQVQYPRWQGEALAGRSILIGCEAGHGDMIQFCRYAPLLRAQGAARIGILCHPALSTLFGGMTGFDAVISLEQGMPVTGWDCWTPALSLPLHCHTRLDTIPATIPYLHANAALQAEWAPHLPAPLRVGLVWKGSTQFENDADRSLPSLQLLAPLAAVHGVEFVSLQKGAGEEDAAPAGLRLTRLGAPLRDFADTAAVVSQLDLVICVDTAVAHLAGALGRPCWVLLPYYKADWRWLTVRSDTPWYPGVMRLFRQPRMGDWETVVVEVRDALQQWAHAAISHSASVG